ncbi:MAG: hypothetical protein ACP5QI_06635 [Candidatus Bathyarchaeia archaeon]
MSLKEEFLSLLERDREFSYAVAGLLGLEKILKRMDNNERQLIKLRRDMLKGFKHHAEEVAMLRRHLDALGARWGLMAKGPLGKALRGCWRGSWGLGLSVGLEWMRKAKCSDIQA